MVDQPDFQTENNEPLATSDLLNFDRLSKATALQLVLQTFDRYRNWRYRNCDLRWNSADALYFGYVPKRKWEGTNIARSSLGHQITFDQIESVLPILVNGIFGDPEWFQVWPSPDGSATVDEARATQNRLFYLLEQPRNRKGDTARNHIKLAAKSILIYGNGYIHLDYDPVLKGPVPNWLDTRDLFLAPGTASPLVDDSENAIVRKFITWERLEALRDAPGMMLPSAETLKLLAQQSMIDVSDNTKVMAELMRGVSYSPQADAQVEVMPAQRGIETLIYYSENRIIWVLGRQYCVLNIPNPFGFIPVVGGPCFNVLGRHYAQGFCDVLEGNQRYLQGIINSHLDELALTLNPPRSVKRSSNWMSGQQSWRPGLVMTHEDPSKDFAAYPPQTVTASTVWQILPALEAWSEKRTGANQMITQGMPLRSNASRTSAGINSQISGPTSRIQYIVTNIEDYLIIPMLYKMQVMDAVYNKGTETVPGLNPNTRQPSQVPTASVSKPMNFLMMASSKMLNRQSLMQVFPFIMQYISQGPFMQQLAQQGQTINWQEMFRMLQDAAGTKWAYNLVRPMSQQEQQSMNAPPPALQMQMAQKDKELQAKQQIEQGKAAATMEQAKMRLAVELARLEDSKDVRDQKTAVEVMKLIAKSMDSKIRERVDQVKALTGLVGKSQDHRAAANQSVLDTVLGQVGGGGEGEGEGATSGGGPDVGQLMGMLQGLGGSGSAGTPSPDVMSLLGQVAG